MDIIISSLQKIFEDDRGESFSILNDRRGDFMLGYRKAGSSSGRHYHTGKAAYKNPEILYLLSGEIVFRWRKLDETTVHEQNIVAPARIEVPAMLWHELVAVTDCSFWEMNSLEDVKKDSIRLE